MGRTRHDVDRKEYVDLANSPQFKSSTAILIDGEYKGSGTLIKPEWLLTAGHVVSEVGPDNITVKLADSLYQVKNVILHPKFEWGFGFGGADLALIRLRKSVTSVFPSLIYGGKNGVGRVATLVGWGSSGTALENELAPSGTKLAGNNVIDQLGGTIEGRSIPENYYVADFDHPSDTTLNQTGDAIALPLEYLGSGGDSGGGLFIEIQNTWLLVGVCSIAEFPSNSSRKSGAYGTIQYFNNVSTEIPWIAKHVGGLTVPGLD